MSVGTNLRVNSTSEKDTETIAESIGKNLRGGEILELVGDVGSGKTTFVRGLARGLGYKGNVSSPSFTISRIYDGGKLSLKHFDFYRLNEAGILEFDLDETIKDPASVTVIEWSDVVKNVLPGSKLVINFVVSGRSARQLVLNYPESLGYAVKDVGKE